MLLNLINPSKYNSYNITLAQTWGLECAVYVSTILSFSNSDDYVKINRDKIKEITTLSKEQQYSYDTKLAYINIVDKKDKDIIKINIDNLLSMFNEDNTNIAKDLGAVVRKKRTKADIMKENLKGFVTTTVPELRDAYSSWIDAVVSKQGWMSQKSVEVGQKRIDEYSGRNLDIALDLLNIASIGGYRDIEWAINDYEKKQKETLTRRNFNSYSPPPKPVKLADDVF